MPIGLELQDTVPQAREPEQNVFFGTLTGDDKRHRYSVLPLIEDNNCVQGVLREARHTVRNQVGQKKNRLHKKKSSEDTQGAFVPNVASKETALLCP
jgi:hypothetical protein